MYFSNKQKPDLFIKVEGAFHFLKWELPHFAKKFNIVDKPTKKAICLVYGPDAFCNLSEIPSIKKVAYLFPGFGINPLHDLEKREEILKKIEDQFDLVLINPGPLEKAFENCKKIVKVPFSINENLLTKRKDRKVLNSLLHVSADYPQKDWQRSQECMHKTNLKYEVYPSRKRNISKPASFLQIAMKRLLNKTFQIIGINTRSLPNTYTSHLNVIKKYYEYDGFVHIASDVKDKKHIDGKYTACLMEAGASGSICFWHDTFNLGNDLETVFSLPLDPCKAALEITNIKKSLNVPKHSAQTRMEMLDKFSSFKSVEIRSRAILERI